VEGPLRLAEHVRRRAAEHDGARLALRDAAEFDEPVLANHDLLNQVAGAEDVSLGVVKGGADLTAGDQREALDAVEIGVLDRRDALVAEHLLGVVVDELAVDEEVAAVRGDLLALAFVRQVFRRFEHVRENGGCERRRQAKERRQESRERVESGGNQIGTAVRRIRSNTRSRHTRFLRRLVHHISERQRHHESVQKVILARSRGQSLPPERAPEPFRRRERGRAQTAHRRRKQSFQPSQRRERRVKNLRRPTFPRRL